MTDKPSEDERPDADAVFQRTLGNLVNTPHKPHASASTPSGKKKSTTRKD